MENIQYALHHVKEGASGSDFKRFAILAGSPILGGLTSRKINQNLVGTIYKERKDVDKKRNKELFNALVKNNIRDASKELVRTKDINAFDLGGGDQVYTSGDATALAHELGHRDISRSFLGRLLQNKATLTMGNLAPSASGMVSLYNAMPHLARTFGEVPKTTMGDAARFGLQLGTNLMALPQLAYEAEASRRGIDLLREAKATPEELENAKKHLMKCWATYLVDKATPGVFNIAAHVTTLK